MGREGTKHDAQDLWRIAEALGVTAGFLLFDNVPRDERMDIPNAELLKLFEKLSTMDEKTRSVAKERLDSLLFNRRVAQKFEKRAGSNK